MAKVVKAMSSEVFHVKVTAPYYDLDNDAVDPDSPYRVIAIRPDMPLVALGFVVLEVFAFEADHMFGFYDNLKDWVKSKTTYEFSDTIDSAYDSLAFGGKVDKSTYSLEDHTAKDIFTAKGKKWLMLYDYGEEWNFWLSLEGIEPVDPDYEYPCVIGGKHDAPEQYPDLDEEED